MIGHAILCLPALVLGLVLLTAKCTPKEHLLLSSWSGGKLLALGIAKGVVTGICSSTAAGNSCSNQSRSRGNFLWVSTDLLLCSALVIERDRSAHCHLHTKHCGSTARGTCLQRSRAVAGVAPGAGFPAL